MAVNRNLSTHLNPSLTTSVLLSKLPSSVVETELKETLKPTNCRKVELEPGCSLHFINEYEASVAAKFVESKYSLEVI